MADQWFVQRDGQKFGPFSPAQLKQMTTTGQLLPVDLVSKGEGGKWVAASQIKGLFAIFASIPVPSATTSGTLPPPISASEFDFADPARETATAVSSHQQSTHRGRSRLFWVGIGGVVVIVAVVVVFLVTQGSNTASPSTGSKERLMKEHSLPGSDGPWSEKAFVLSGEKKDPAFKPAPAGSLQDFFDAVNVLSVSLANVPLRSGAKVPCRFHAPGCEVSVWQAIFGKPEQLSKGRERIGRVENEFDRWRVRCTDGSVTVQGKIQQLGDKTYYFPTMILVD